MNNNRSVRVPDDVVAQSTWDETYACWHTPDGRAWVYTDDPNREGVSWRTSGGEPISVPVWLDDTWDTPIEQGS